jgi:hypothetical protein
MAQDKENGQHTITRRVHIVIGIANTIDMQHMPFIHQSVHDNGTRGKYESSTVARAGFSTLLSNHDASQRTGMHTPRRSDLMFISLAGRPLLSPL